MEQVLLLIEVMANVLFRLFATRNTSPGARGSCVQQIVLVVISKSLQFSNAIVVVFCSC